MKEKHDIEMLMKDTGLRVNDWMDQADKLFNFAKTAKDIFDTTKSLEVKKDILMALGSNLTLKDKILNVYLEKPLLLIKEVSNEVKTIKEGLEPLNNGSTKRNMKDLYPQFPTLLEWLQDVRNYFIEEKPRC